VNPGDQAGHYTIVEALGKGGMGEVFVAEDARLHRRVALKVLPQILASDPGARERFEREAQAVAALNHPNIVTIHSVEEHGGRLFLTMELVDGRPLSETIPKGGMPLDRLLRIGIEVADAMSAAQQRGITHRDVKPANIMLTASGRVKVLDFGLAKIRDAEAARATDDLTRMSSRSDLTGEGKIIGTVAYMSPEQAEGKPVDPRSDIFSLGVVLHEMATGERPFKGDTNVSIISAILKDTPAPITDSNPNLPADLARIIRRCLAKDPDRRYQTAADLRNELEELRQDTASGTVTIARAPRRPRRRMFAIAAIAFGAFAAAAGAWVTLNHAAAGRRGSHAFTLDKITRLTTTGSAFIATISPDGRYVVHVKGEDRGVGLWMRQTATTSDVRIVPPADVRVDGLVFSPDGDYIFYSAYPGIGGVASLYRVPVLGGTATKVIEDIDSPVTFAPDGRQIAFLRGSMVRGTTELIVAGTSGGNAHAVATATAPDRFASEGLAWSPDGKTILVPAASTRPGVLTVMYAVDLASGTAHPVGDPWAFLRDVQWLPDGRSYLLTAVDMSGQSNPQIWQVTYPEGVRSRVTNDLNTYFGLSLSSDATSLATVQAEITASVYIAEGADKAPRRVSGGPGRADGNNGLAWMPDGRIVFSSTASGLPQLWITDANGQNATQLTSLPGPAGAPSPSADGKWIYFTSFARDGSALFRIAPDGSGIEQLTHDGDARNGVISLDGRTIYYTAQRSGAPRLMAMPSGGGAARQVVPGFFRVGAISFDGARLIGGSWSDEQRRAVTAIVSLAEGTLEQRPDLSTTALWMPDGGLGFVRRTGGKSSVVVQAPGAGVAHPITPPDEQQIYGGAVSRDGRIAFSRGVQTSDVVLIKAK
jgi:Tol biopolymer transport system component